MIDEIDSISSPSLDFSSVETKPISDELIAAPSWLVIFPTKLNSEAPFPSFPSVVIYETVITLPFDNFLAITLSPKINSYLSSSTSCKRYAADVDVIPIMLSICW